MSKVKPRIPSVVAGCAPESIHTPATIPELRDLVGDRNERTLVPVGGGTQLALGNAPNRPFSLVFLKKALQGEVEHEPTDLTAVAPAGVTLGELGAQLAESGQCLPFDPPHSEEVTLGGGLAVGIGGPVRTRYGLPRDFVLGMTVLRADSELVKAGGRVVKNVTGYDLMRLWSGSLGTIGIVTSVALRVFPLTETIDLQCELDSLAAGQALAEKFLRADLRPELLDLTKKKGDWHGTLRLSQRAVSKAKKLAATDLVLSSEKDYLEVRDLGFGEKDVLTLRASCPTSAIASTTKALEKLAPSQILVRPLAREVRTTWNAQSIPHADAVAATIGALRTELAKDSGIVVAERIPDEMRGAIDTWGTSQNFQRMAAVKSAFDPYNRLNAGRFVGGL
ncbi:MAG: hypothetical protein CL897_03865 [Dehalococcoidia bacterium]|nr:hypothetical protein [Dehalococcoidia bacterium]|tara:strand:- start:5821 stop:6999 length:1179 start_codon:yes stop_codon:yes gene_type:complete